MNRIFKLVPGYDCIAKPCGKNGCGTRPGASHGRHCNDWVYVVQDGDCALSLTVFSGDYPNSRKAAPKGADITLHVAFSISRDEIAGRENYSQDCTWVPGGKCYGGGHFSGSLMASEFFDRHFVAGISPDEQPDTFWLALEARCAEWAAEARAQRADTVWRKCACCGGEGTVRIDCAHDGKANA